MTQKMKETGKSGYVKVKTVKRGEKPQAKRRKITSWNLPETAPRDGTMFIADIGYPFPVICFWNSLYNEFTYPCVEAEPVHFEIGQPEQWSSYFVTESANESELRGWIPLPKINNKRKNI